MPDDLKNQIKHPPQDPPADLKVLKKQLGERLLTDRFSCGRYATDASIYQMVPHGVVIPETVDDVRTTLNFARENGLAILPRGGEPRNVGKPLIMLWFWIKPNI